MSQPEQGPSPAEEDTPTTPTPSRHRRGRTVLLVVGTLVVALVAGAGALAWRLRTNITTLDVGDALSAPAPAASPDATVAAPSGEQAPPPGKPLNILVMGSDTREGQGKGFGSAELIAGARSDTTLLVHLAGDRQSATVLSFPRDLVVTLPSCRMADGTQTYPYQDRFNAAFFIGGPECTIRTVRELTGLPVHHFVVVDFQGFTRVVDALGGVEVCLQEAVDDREARLTLPAGVQRVSGDDALAFVRARKSLGDGSDLQRIERQQDFMASMVREVTSRELLTNPVRLFRTLDETTKSLTMDQRLADVGRLVDLAGSASGIDPEDVAFVTYPNVYSDDFVTVRPDELHAQPIIDAIAADRPWPPPAADGGPVAVRPRDVTLTVVNATGREDEATKAAAVLDLLGFGSVTLASDDPTRRTKVLVGPGAKDEARTVAASVDGATIVRSPDVVGVQLVLGLNHDPADWRTVKVLRPEGWQDPDGTPPPGGTKTADVATCAA
jgi:LCP family protein required for cell wall assembly